MAILIVFPPAVLVMTQFTLAVAGDALDQLGDGQVKLFGVCVTGDTWGVPQSKFKSKM
eukprot:COSAG05_NODE_2195_length_3413_cov_24.923959_4_plen_57_part_01